MTTRRTGSRSKGSAKRLEVKKETLKDLDAKDAKGVKGGTLMATVVACQRGRLITGACGQKTD